MVTDWEACRRNKGGFIVYATDDDGFGYGMGGWLHSGDTVTLAWGYAPYRPINDGIERALCWRPVGYPGVDYLRALATKDTPNV